MPSKISVSLKEKNKYNSDNESSDGEGNDLN